MDGEAGLGQREASGPTMSASATPTLHLANREDDMLVPVKHAFAD